MEKLDAEKEQVIANTWKTYIDAGVLEPYQVAYLQFGDELDKIPVPEKYQLPPVETVQEEPEENDTDKRITELEAKDELSEEEQKELDELKKKQGNSK